MQPVESVQMNIYQSNTYRKDLNWLYLNEPMVQERKQWKSQQSCISVFVAYPTIPSSNYEHQPRHDNSIPLCPYGRFIEIQSNLGEKNFIEQIKAPIFLEAILVIEIM